MIRRNGLSPWVRFPIRAQPDRPPLLVHERLENLIHHAEMRVPLELPCEIGQVAYDIRQAMGEQPGDLEGEVGMSLKKLGGLFDADDTDRRHRLHRGHMRRIEQRGNLAEERTGIEHDLDLHVTFENLDLALDEDIEQTRPSALRQKDLALGQGDRRQSFGEAQ